MTVFFNGRQLSTPQSASMLDDSAMYNKNTSSGNVAAIIGRSDGGKPFTALRFGSATEARAVLKGDDVTLKAIERAFDPSAETTGQAELIFVRINPATQASAALNDGSSNPVINLVSSDYGIANNQIKYKIESGTLSGKKLTTQLANAYFTQDNVARNAFDVLYAGSGTGTISVADASVTLKVAGSAVATLDLTVFSTIQSLVDRINTLAGFSANVRDGNGEKPSLHGLDFVTDADCKTAQLIVTAHLQACVDWFNGLAEGFVDATRVANAGTLPANVPFTYLAGATNGTVTNTQWQQAFDVLQQEDVQWVTPLSELSAIHAMADAHVAFMSSTTNSKRRAICGDATGIADSAALIAAKALNSDRTSYTHLGAYDYNSAGVLTLYPAYCVAASLSGMFAGVTPGTALTNKSTKWRGMERKLRIPTDTDALIDGGVLCMSDTANGIKVVKSNSTWLVNDNFNRVEQSTGAACDYTLRTVQEAVDQVRGKGATPRTLADALSRAETKLQQLSQPEPVGPGILVGDVDNPAFRKLQGSIDGDVISISYECSPVVPANFILQTAHAVPFSSTVKA